MIRARFSESERELKLTGLKFTGHNLVAASRLSRIFPSIATLRLSKDPVSSNSVSVVEQSLSTGGLIHVADEPHPSKLRNLRSAFHLDLSKHSRSGFRAASCRRGKDRHYSRRQRYPEATYFHSRSSLCESRLSR